ncbi:hypothetical protein EGW74_09955 [Enterococcus casseliflavus]|nr:hypothetical protein EGW74_09955 [Enterococcus casseliflavus]
MGLPLLSAFLSYQILARLDSSLPTKKEASNRIFCPRKHPNHSRFFGFFQIGKKSILPFETI